MFITIKDSAVFQENLTIEGNPNTGFKLSLRNFFVTASPGYPEPHELSVSTIEADLFSGNTQSFRTLSRETLAQMEAAETHL